MVSGQWGHIKVPIKYKLMGGKLVSSMAGSPFRFASVSQSLSQALVFFLQLEQLLLQAARVPMMLHVGV